MSQELDEQQRITYELREQLRSLEAERVRINELIKILEAKLVVQDLREEVRVKTEIVNQLRIRRQELEEKLGRSEVVPASETQIQPTPNQEEPSREFF